MHTPLHNPSLEGQAQRRAKAQFSWLIHAGVYLAVNAGLLLLTWGMGRHWATFPALGWGLALAIHGLVVLARGSSLKQRLLERERQRLTAREESPQSRQA